MENEKSKFHLKHPEIWIGALLLSITVAILAFVYSCQNLNKKVPGLYLIEPQVNDDIKYYSDDFSFYAYFDGTSDEINASINNVTNIYSEKLAYYYASVDDETIYTTYPSIARLNEKPNEEVLLGTTVIDFLKLGYDYYNSYSNYSIFSAPLYSFWYQQFSLYSTERNNRDPLNNSDSVAYLKTLADYINSKDHINLEFIGNDKAKINVSDEYLNFRKDNEITASFVSLNLIKNEIIMDKMADFLEENNVDNGFIISKNGSIIELKNTNTQTYNLYTLNEKKVEVYATLALNSKRNAITVYRRFNLSDSEIPSAYIISKDGVNYYRSLYIDILTGLNNNVLLNSAIYYSGGKISESALINNELAKFKSNNEIITYINSINNNNVQSTFNIVNNVKNVYVSKEIKENIKLNTELDYNLNII